MHRFLLSLITLLLSATVAAELRIGLGGEPSTLDPHRYNLRIEETVLTDLFEGLVTFAADGSVAPGVAESWQTSDDGLTWQFNLRRDARWSDGHPVTAEDFVYAFRRLLNPATAASLAYFMYPLANAREIATGEAEPHTLGVQAEQPHTLVITLAAPYPYLPERLLYPTGYPVPRHVVERVGDDWVRPEHWVSNGAYTLKDWRPQEAIELARNKHFHTPATLAGATYVPVASAQNAFNRYRTGDLQAIAGFPAGELERLRAERPAELREAPLQSAFYLAFNTTKPPFNDVRIRRALALAVEPRVLTHQVLKTGDIPSESLVPPMVPRYTPPALPHANLPQAERLRLARALLADAGVGERLEVTLKHAAGIANKKASLAIAGMWRQIGVRTRLHQAELRAHYADLRQGNFEVGHAAWLGEANPEHYLALLYSGTGDTNYGRYANAEYDALFEQAKLQADVAARHALLAQAEAVASADYPVMPLYAAASQRLVSTRIRGWRENARDVHPLRYLAVDP